MTKEEIEHEELWIAGIIDSVLSRSNNNTDKFIINLKKVGYKVVKIESENERLKAEREWISVEQRLPELDGNSQIKCIVLDTYNGIVVRPYNEYHKCWDDEDCDDFYCPATGGNITHWMPLPQPPKQ